MAINFQGYNGSLDVKGETRTVNLYQGESAYSDKYVKELKFLVAFLTAILIITMLSIGQFARSYEAEINKLEKENLELKDKIISLYESKK